MSSVRARLESLGLGQYADALEHEHIGGQIFGRAYNWANPLIWPVCVASSFPALCITSPRAATPSKASFEIARIDNTF